MTALETHGRPVRLIVADHRAVVRRGLAAIFAACSRLRLLGEAENGEDALQLSAMVRPDVALIGALLPAADGLDAVRAIKRRWPGVHVLALDDQGEQAARLALEAGASRCLSLALSPDELVEAVLQANLPPLDETQTLPNTGPPARPSAEAQVEALHNGALLEMKMAGRVQAGMLPEKPPVIPGWDAAACLLPARETSGDFYDFIPLPNGKWGLAIADVTDKGLGAAVFMALSSSLLRTYAAQFPTLPALTMASVNERILNDTRGSLYVTAVYAILEPLTGRLRYVNAGHNPPVLLRAQKGKPVDRLLRTGMALGILRESFWQQKIVKLIPGDVLLLYTDGVTEALSPQGEQFGEKRLMDIVRPLSGRPAHGIQQAVLGELERFTRGEVFQDDVTLLILRRK